MEKEIFQGGIFTVKEKKRYSAPDLTVIFLNNRDIMNDSPTIPTDPSDPDDLPIV